MTQPSQPQKFAVFTTGGTFDKIYYDALSDYKIGPPQVKGILRQARLNLHYDVNSVLKKDSLDMTDKDRQRILEKVRAETARHCLIIHGTDTMVETAKVLTPLRDKVIVLTGAMQPARFTDSDAHFNTGFALAAALLLEPGVYIAMNGEIFTPGLVQKNRAAGRFSHNV